MCGHTYTPVTPPPPKEPFTIEQALFLNCCQTRDSPSQNKTALYHQAVCTGSAEGEMLEQVM